MHRRSYFSEEKFEKKVRPQSVESVKPANPSNVKVFRSIRVSLTLPYLMLALLIFLFAAFVINKTLFASAQERIESELNSSAEIVRQIIPIVESDLSFINTQVGTKDNLQRVIAGDDAEWATITNRAYLTNHADMFFLFDKDKQLIMQDISPTNSGMMAYDAEDIMRADFSHFFQNYDQREGVALEIGLVSVAQKTVLILGKHYEINGDEYTLLVGKRLSDYVCDLRQSAVAHISIYDGGGALLASTLEDMNQAIDGEPFNHGAFQLPNDHLDIRQIDMNGRAFSELISPLDLEETEGDYRLGISLEHALFKGASLTPPTIIIRIVLVGFLAVSFIGLFIADRFVTPLTEMANVAKDVADGNFDRYIHTKGSNEISVLGHAMNRMIDGLKEGNMYRALLGRAVSPPVREKMRNAFSSGDLVLSGQRAVATVLMTDISGFTEICEEHYADTILKLLNEYFAVMMPIVKRYDGVIHHMAGDSMAVSFGIMPTRLTQTQSAFAACLAAKDIALAVKALNRQREKKGEPLFITGIGVNTGVVIAGGIGTADRLNYTIVGDAVNIAQRIEAYTRVFEETSIVISRANFDALGENRAKFEITLLGSHTLPGKKQPVEIYRLFI